MVLNRVLGEERRSRVEKNKISMRSVGTNQTDLGKFRFIMVLQLTAKFGKPIYNERSLSPFFSMLP
ncbi:hypothetical protein C7B61_03920 [filamentous cyanobacterium CCP1]|nr:hypothetical protein C7B76_02640 [filamentous cyanobacterium CCP2]PSB67860.1 hypothetical protein C7B61_03920 [filamentous cyanobacterium CCP1]